MALFSGHLHSFISFLSFILVVFLQGVTAATFTFINKCDYTPPTGWAGRFWGRTGCNFDDSGRGSYATAEFTLGSGSQDFYDVSLVDGYNLPMIVEGNGESGECATTGCMTDLNKKCPSELQIEGRGALFKSACPKSYSYAFDDATSTFNSTGADYTITFCPNVPSLKSSEDPATAKATGSDPVQATRAEYYGSQLVNQSERFQETSEGNLKLPCSWAE
ncbi:Detected protein of unknown function [Hibiscus syriacus]|uniref:Thaumatin-like protein 1 n=1 Tax=Hibiscus syriacus TaxID=106335 RepID=A0A6A3AGX5_HIBSY|nr:Detected protein of unknown function [Hibiscus syriacus]